MRDAVVEIMRKSVFLSVLFLLSAFVRGCGGGSVQTSAPISQTRLLLDTFCTITIYDPQAEALLEEALDICERYEAMLSISTQGSDVWRVNHAGGEPVVVSQETVELITAGIMYGKLSGGLFDITIGRLSSLWDFTGQSGVPSDSEIAAAQATVDYTQVRIDGDTVQLLNPEAWIDLGGVAKGYIADKIAEYLREKGVGAAVIDLGGNIVAVGEKPDRSTWRFGIAKPFSERNDLLGVIKTGEASVVSAGVYERQFESGGVRYHHILNPFTGMPVNSDTLAATVVSTRSLDGDALSTIIILMGAGDKSRANEYVGGSLTDLLDKTPGFAGALFVLESGEIRTLGDISMSEN